MLRRWYCGACDKVWNAGTSPYHPHALRRLCVCGDCRAPVVGSRNVCADPHHGLIVARQRLGLHGPLPIAVLGRGMWLFLERLKRGLSRSVIAQRLRVHPTVVWSWELLDRPIDPKFRPELCFLEIPLEAPQASMKESTCPVSIELDIACADNDSARE